MSLPPVVHITIYNYNTQENTTVRPQGWEQATPGYIIHHRRPGTDLMFSPMPQRLFGTIERRVEAQPQVSQILEEVSAQREASPSHIGTVASFATRILSVVKENQSLDMHLVDLSMDAHALAYISVISALYRGTKISRKKLQEIVSLMDTIYALLAKATSSRSAVALIKRFLTRTQQKFEVLRMREDLLKLLREIEKNDDADILSSLDSALDFHRQCSDDNDDE